MKLEDQNLLIIMSDEHSSKALGCYGHEFVVTPNIDKLASQGVRFASAYCTSPVCVPARASFATGKYVHQIGYWDNANAYDGAILSWHHQLRERGHRVVSIGKLHFREYDEDHGFDEELLPMHILDGKGDLMGLIRDELPVRQGAYKMAELAGPGESQYTSYDREILLRAQSWLRDEGTKDEHKPWVLFVSFVSPHFPLTAPPEHYYKYYDKSLPIPKLYDENSRPDHPFLNDYRSSFNYDDYFDAEKLRKALAGYYGLCSFLDHNIGKLLETLDKLNLDKNTRVLYTSDHGDNLGARGLWGKSTLYEESVAVPLIVKGDGLPSGKTVSVPVSHVDVMPFIYDAVGLTDLELDENSPGVSLFKTANDIVPRRNVLAEYHGMGSRTGAFMIRYKQYKYIYYVDYPHQLFDLENDPEEIKDLTSKPEYSKVIEECKLQLYAICDPVRVDEMAKAQQKKLLQANGGREAVIERGDLGFSPVPGHAHSFDK